MGDWLLRWALRKRAGQPHRKRVCRRVSDGSLWVAGHPEDFGLAMRGLFSGKGSWHFYKARYWRGLLIASPRVFWLPKGRDFRLVDEVAGYVLPRWPDESVRVRARLKGE